MILLPSGAELNESFTEPIGGIVYGKLEMPSISHNTNKDMAMSQIYWNPQKIFTFLHSNNHHASSSSLLSRRPSIMESATAISLSGQSRNEAFKSDFQTSVGGLQTQIDAIVRRVLDGRIIRPADEETNDTNENTNSNQNASGDMTQAQLSMAAIEAEELELLGLAPVRGLLLYGPPGCGKAALAREISNALRAWSPIIISAPEPLDRWVGGSEKLVRALFVEAEAELSVCNGDATKSSLYVIVIATVENY